MKAAVFSDVHGNLVALNRFVQSTRGLVDSYLCLGDVVGYGPWNDECLEIVRRLPGIVLLEGNHERLFLGVDQIDRELALVQTFFRHSRQYFLRRDLILDLPRHAQIGDFECTHTISGRPIYKDTDIQIAHNYFIGHSHHQFQIQRSGFALVNPGSVGQNRTWIDMVDYLIYDLASREITMRSVPYDIDAFVSELRLRGYPEQCVRYYAGKPRRASQSASKSS